MINVRQGVFHLRNEEASYLFRVKNGFLEHLPFGEARWCVGPATTAHQFRRLYGNQVCRLSDPPESRTFYLVTQKGQPLRASAKLFLEDLRGHLRHIEGVQIFSQRLQ